MSDATLSFHETRERSAALEEEVVTALVVVWSAAEPDRVGEVALLGPGETAELGRELDGKGALRFLRQRPFGNEPRPPLAGAGISRQQLKLKGRPGAIAIESVGRCPMVAGGEEVARALVVPGDIVTLKGQLVLYCVSRTRALPAAHDFRPEDAGAFGRADRFGLVGESPVVWELRDQLAFAAKAGTHTLVTGESGTGKELAARAIHLLSSRAQGRFVSRNAATIPAGLVDAELFGNVRNYPNAGTPERLGLIGEASGGTLFLDEIGELPTDLQAHLLRVLDGGEYHRLGESSAKRANLRLIGATNRDPTELKHDLLPRLAMRVEMPSLSDRREDIPQLVLHLLARAAERAPDAVERFRGATGHFAVDPGLIEALLVAPLSGNIRDLDAALWAAMSESKSGTIRIARDRRSAVPERPTTEPAASTGPRSEPTEAEVRAVIAARKGNLLRASVDLGLPSRYSLYRLLKKLGIGLDDVRDAESRG